MCKNVLIVDDDAGFVWQIMNNIQNRDCSIATANSLLTAEHILDNNKFDVVVANVNVPGGSSLELTKTHYSQDKVPLYVRVVCSSQSFH